MKIRSVGVDLGGTWLRAWAVDGRGRALRAAARPAPSPPALAAALARLWKEWRVPSVPVLVVGSKGIWKPAARRAAARALRSLAAEVRVMSDVELAHAAVLGGRPGLLILAGTGSIALARDAEGRWARAGGLGPKKGDEGSGFWIGREFLRRTGKAAPVPSAEGVRKTASLAAKVLSRAARDPLCAGIVREAQGHLAGLLRVLLANGRRAGGKVRVGWSGGLFQDAGFRRGFFRRLRAEAPRTRFEVFSPRRPAARAAALMGTGGAALPGA